MRSIVFSTVSHLDMYTGEDRKDRWRPLLELLRIHDFKVDRLYFFISHLYRHIVPTLVKDMNNVCPETEIVPVITNLNGVLTYEDIAPAYKVFSAYFEQYRFDLSNERYFFHLGPGNLFQHALMLIMLFHFKRLPFQMLRLAPNPEKPGDIIMEIYEGDIRKWIASIADSEKRNVAAQTFLKSCIETRNPVFNKLIEEMEHVATHSTAPVLLSGPTGSGKSHLARKIYELRYNKGLVPGSFVEVNCATLQGESVLSNLFGHVRGSFTGATTVRQGLLKTAHEGILFLDEIAEIPLQIQVILLKAIEEKKFYPFGSDTPVHSDFQLICGTNRDLAEEVRQGRFRQLGRAVQNHLGAGLSDGLPVFPAGKTGGKQKRLPSSASLSRQRQLHFAAAQKAAACLKGQPPQSRIGRRFHREKLAKARRPGKGLLQKLHTAQPGFPVINQKRRSILLCQCAQQGRRAEGFIKSIFRLPHSLFRQSSVFLIQSRQPLDQQILIINHLGTAQGEDKLSNATCEYDGGFDSQLCLHPCNHAVQHTGSAQHDAAAHAVNGVLANDTLRNIQADGRKLRSFAA